MAGAGEPAKDAGQEDKVGLEKAAQRPSMPLFEFHPEDQSLRDFNREKEGLGQLCILREVITAGHCKHGSDGGQPGGGGSPGGRFT